MSGSYGDIQESHFIETLRRGQHSQSEQQFQVLQRVRSEKRGLGLAMRTSLATSRGHFSVWWGQELDYRKPKDKWWQRRVCGCRRNRSSNTEENVTGDGSIK